AQDLQHQDLREPGEQGERQAEGASDGAESEASPGQREQEDPREPDQRAEHAEELQPRQRVAVVGEDDASGQRGPRLESQLAAQEIKTQTGDDVMKVMEDLERR